MKITNNPFNPTFCYLCLAASVLAANLPQDIGNVLFVCVVGFYLSPKMNCWQMHTDHVLAHSSTKVIKPVQLSTVLLQGYGRIIDLDIKWICA